MGRTEVLNTLEIGAFFGELGALGFRKKSVASILTCSPVDLRVLPGIDVADWLDVYPDLGQVFLRIAEKNGFKMAEQLPLNNHSMFSGLGNELLAQLEEEMPTKVFFKGKVLFKQGSRAYDFYIHLDGILDITLDGEACCELGAPSVLGEAAVLQLASNSDDEVPEVRFTATCK